MWSESYNELQKANRTMPYTVNDRLVRKVVEQHGLVVTIHGLFQLANRL